MLLHFRGSDDGFAPIAQDDGDSWWAGQAQSFVSVALAGVLAANTLGAQLATSMFVDDVPPAGVLRGQLDEDFWQNPVAPVPLSFVVPAPHAWQQEECFPQLAGPPDEDYWQNPVAPVGLSFRFPDPASFEQHEQANGLRGQPEDTPWQNAVAPVSASSIVPPPFGWYQDDAFPPAKPSEDYWQNAVAPVVGSSTVPSPWRWEQHPQAYGLVPPVTTDGIPQLLPDVRDRSPGVTVWNRSLAPRVKDKSPAVLVKDRSTDVIVSVRSTLPRAKVRE